MFEDTVKNIVEDYWDKFQKYVVKIKEPRAQYSKTVLQIYEERAERFNDGSDNRYTAKSLFFDVCDDITLMIIDETYVLKHIVMREETYQLYDYYDANYASQFCPSFSIYDNEKCVASISSNDWRWWVEECDMLR